MKLSFPFFFAVMLFSFSICLCRASVAWYSIPVPTLVQVPLCHDDERIALLRFKQSLTYSKSNCFFDNVDDHNKIGSWSMEGEGSTTNCCLWGGVKCDKKTGHVTKLNLTDSCLSGSLNSTSTLFHLVHLRWLSLAWNNFSYSRIPSEIKNLSKLYHLDLSNSEFFGQIPSEILELTQLQYLDISSKTWQYMPALSLQQPGLGSVAEKLTNLKTLILDNVNISSSIPNSMANLSILTFVSLRHCHLQGTLPSSIGNLTKLVHLDIATNDFSEKLPIRYLGSLQLRFLDLGSNNVDLSSSRIAKQTKLNHLGLQNVNLAGGIPLWLMNLTHLTHLSMDYNQLSGPFPHWLMNLNRLSFLDLSYNQLTGHIPSEIGHLTRLEFLHLSFNILQGPLPSSIIQLKCIRFLDLHSNKLNGTVDLDKYLLKLTSLEILGLSTNNFSVLTTVNTATQRFRFIGLGSCRLVSFPNFLQNQHGLQGLNFGSNNITGQIPGWLLNISDGLQLVNLSHNLFTGFDQHCVEPFGPSLQTLDLRYNNLQGSIPLPSSSIQFYLASNNNLTGEIPAEICSYNQIRALDLSYNNLSGVLPRCLGNISHDLSILGLQGNNFCGRIPETFIKESKLKMIDLSRNKLEGKIPRSLAHCTSLEFVNLGYNQITDTFPSWLGNLPELKVLILKFNKLYGGIIRPRSKFNFSKLQIIDLSYNVFFGKLPSKYFQFWDFMKVVNGSQLLYMEERLVPSSFSYAFADFSYYAYEFMMDNKGIVIAYGKISNKVISINLSGNKFIGEIPACVSNLRALKILNLSNNNLFGSIPSSLSNLMELESLDLSNNKLSGKIPQQLVALTFLAYINVSHNNLMGLIPQGGQFDTFDNRSFEGNPRLCGKPLSKLCDNYEVLLREKDHGSVSIFSFDWKVVSGGVVSGLIVGIILGNEYWATILVWFETIFGRQLVRRNRRRWQRRN